MTDDPINMTSAGLSGVGVSIGGGLGNNRVDAAMISTVLQSQEAAIRQLLSSQGLGRNINLVT